MGWPHVRGAIGVVEVDDHGIKYLRLQIYNLIIPPFSDRAVAASSGMQQTFKTEVCLDWVTSSRQSVVPIVQKKCRYIGHRLGRGELYGW